nr:ATP-binding cassette domain-containing protein [Klebsiella pneumoniae subsp. pneumoniae]
MALIGESGSGKSVTLRALMPAPAGSSELSGTLQVGDDEVLTMSASQLRRYRGGRCAMIFRSRCWPSIRSTPSGSRLLKGCAAKGCRARRPGTGRWRPCAVRIPSPERRLDAYPHEMSGGMRQRAMIALALSVTRSCCWRMSRPPPSTPRCKSRS